MGKKNQIGEAQVHYNYEILQLLYMPTTNKSPFNTQPKWTVEQQNVSQVDQGNLRLYGVPYSARINAKNSSIVEDIVECRERLKLLILIQDTKICVQNG